MGERKVIQKYYPPDFDPSKLPRPEKKGATRQQTVRMMLPMSVKCNSCGEFLGRGKKYNSRKETVTGEDYLGIKVFRFYLKCNRCSAEFTIKTDPKNADYVVEAGVSRNFEPWKAAAAQEQAAAAAAEAEAPADDAMKQLEKRTAESKRELELLDALDELKALKAAQQQLEPEALLDVTAGSHADAAAAEDDAAAAAVAFPGSASFVRRLDDEPAEPPLALLKRPRLERPSNLLLGSEPAPVPPASVPTPAPKILVRPRKPAASAPLSASSTASTPVSSSRSATASSSSSSSSSIGLLAAYPDSD